MLSIANVPTLKNYCDALPSMLPFNQSQDAIKVLFAESYPWKNMCPSKDNVKITTLIKLTSQKSLDRDEGSEENNEDLRIVQLFESFGLSKVEIIVLTVVTWSLTLFTILKCIPKQT